MKEKFLFFLFLQFLFCSHSVFAQQDPLFTYYTVNSTVVNPAMAGTNQTLHFMSVYRSQWVGLEGAPKTSVLAMSTPLLHRGIGIGVSLISDKIGYIEETAYSLDLSYKIVLSQKSSSSINYLRTKRTTLYKERRKKEDVYLSLGLKASVDNFQIRKDKIDLSHGGDSAVNDLYGDEEQANIGFGAYLYSPSYFLSFSIPRLITRKVYEKDFEFEKTNYERMHIYLGGGIIRQISPLFKVRPTIMARYAHGDPLSVDMAVNFLYKEKVWMGAGYRLFDAFFVNFEYYITEMFRMSYAYDLTTTSLNQYSGGTHEVSFSFDIRLRRSPDFCKRYF